MIRLPDTLEKPKLPSNLPVSAKWLAGEGAGSWFLIEPNEDPNLLTISRYSPEGELECTGSFQSKESDLLEGDFEITYPSHCQTVTVVQDEKKIRFENISKLP